MFRDVWSQLVPIYSDRFLDLMDLDLGLGLGLG